MRDPVGEACEAVQAAASGKDKAAIRRMLMAELRSREAPSLPPELLDVAVEKIAAGTYVRGEPLASVSCRPAGLLRVPFLGKAIGHFLEPAFEALKQHISEEGLLGHGVQWVTEGLADSWPMASWSCPHPPGRGFYATQAEEAPPPARLVPDPDLRERMPELFKPLPPPPKLPDTAPIGPEMVFVWLEDSGGTVAVCHKPGRLGVLDAEDAGAYLPLVRAAHAQDKVVAAMADISLSARDLLPATVRVLPERYPAPDIH